MDVDFVAACEAGVYVISQRRWWIKIPVYVSYLYRAPALVCGSLYPRYVWRTDVHTRWGKWAELWRRKQPTTWIVGPGTFFTTAYVVWNYIAIALYSVHKYNWKAIKRVNRDEAKDISFHCRVKKMTGEPQAHNNSRSEIYENDRTAHAKEDLSTTIKSDQICCNSVHVYADNLSFFI
jgi:hypothetical protein